MTLENLTGAFDTSGTDQPGIQHRGQRRELWGSHGVLEIDGDGLAWDVDDITDMIREEASNRNLKEPDGWMKQLTVALPMAQSKPFRLGLCLRASYACTRVTLFLV